MRQYSIRERILLLISILLLSVLLLETQAVAPPLSRAMTAGHGRAESSLSTINTSCTAQRAWNQPGRQDHRPV